MRKYENSFKAHVSHHATKHLQQESVEHPNCRPFTLSPCFLASWTEDDLKTSPPTTAPSPFLPHSSVGQTSIIPTLPPSLPNGIPLLPRLPLSLLRNPMTSVPPPTHHNPGILPQQYTHQPPSGLLQAHSHIQALPLFLKQIIYAGGSQSYAQVGFLSIMHGNSQSGVAGFVQASPIFPIVNAGNRMSFHATGLLAEPFLNTTSGILLTRTTPSIYHKTPATFPIRTPPAFPTTTQSTFPTTTQSTFPIRAPTAFLTTTPSTSPTTTPSTFPIINPSTFPITNPYTSLTTTSSYSQTTAPPAFPITPSSNFPTTTPSSSPLTTSSTSRTTISSTGLIGIRISAHSPCRICYVEIDGRCKRNYGCVEPSEERKIDDF
ncbi:hypothetical protein Pcinc_006902 [Petrolisthes cinctipes]|uniref:Uncharacterized protein n=1 Tax=Petrolisthes cinctipes TaxID=88211 RepID=A0AAE1KXG0_PETCI|nr:hypothetical protein Pcinc_006902 [Petrolisthes cinctipes]